MNLKTYFDETKGTGVLSTSDSDGKVNAAIYSKPHFLEDKLVLIMRDRLSRYNLQSNPHSVYLFIEEGAGYKGKRLYLSKSKEVKNDDRIASLLRRKRDEPTC